MGKEHHVCKGWFGRCAISCTTTNAIKFSFLCNSSDKVLKDRMDLNVRTEAAACVLCMGRNKVLYITIEKVKENIGKGSGNDGR